MAAMHARADRLARRAQEERGRHNSVDAVFEMVDRDSELGGGIIAGALAYRMFIWLLPFALVAVAGLGFAAHASSQDPESAAEDVGLGGLVSNSIATAADGPGRWYALLVGIPLLVWATRSVLRVLIGAHRILWEDVRATAPRPTIVASLELLGVIVCFPLVGVIVKAVRAWETVPGVVASVFAILPYAGLWLLISLRLPHRAAHWKALVPGALLVGLGVELLQLVVLFFLGPYAVAKQGTYGALGAAAAILLGLFLISRLIAASAVVNATLYERHGRPS